MDVNLANNRNEHDLSRIAACRRAYNVMQGAGLCNSFTDVDVIAYY